jgi:hypothetical protein
VHLLVLIDSDSRQLAENIGQHVFSPAGRSAISSLVIR